MASELYEHSFKHIAHPHVFGPGTWWNLHMDGLNADNYDDQQTYIRNVNKKLAALPCLECRNHAMEYLIKNPVNKFSGIEEGYFRWSWEFHNTVNKRLGKPELPYDLAKSLYSNHFNNYCTDCGNEKRIRIKPYKP